MTNIVSHMAGVAICERLELHLVELNAAVDADDPARTAAADHALRNDAMALVGLLSIEDCTSEPILDMLDRVVDALRSAATKLSVQAVKNLQHTNRNLIYLEVGKLRKSGQ